MGDEFDIDAPDTVASGGPFSASTQQTGEEAPKPSVRELTSPSAINSGTLGRLVDMAVARQKARVPKPDEIIPMPIAAVFPSRSGGPGHVVNVIELPDGERAVTCTCEAMKSVGSRPQGCWAMRRMRDIVGLDPL